MRDVYRDITAIIGWWWQIPFLSWLRPLKYHQHRSQAFVWLRCDANVWTILWSSCLRDFQFHHQQESGEMRKRKRPILTHPPPLSAWPSHPCVPGTLQTVAAWGWLWIGRIGRVLRHLWAHYLCTIAPPSAPSSAAHRVDVDADSVGLPPDNATAYWGLCLRKPGTVPPVKMARMARKPSLQPPNPTSIIEVPSGDSSPWSKTTQKLQFIWWSWPLKAF